MLIIESDLPERGYYDKLQNVLFEPNRKLLTLIHSLRSLSH
jgi:hypothetical protein